MPNKWKYYVNSSEYNGNAMQTGAQMQQIQVLLFGTFWNFSPNNLDLWLIESLYVKPLNTEGWL